jgi:hypothetical protein
LGLNSTDDLNHQSNSRQYIDYLWHAALNLTKDDAIGIEFSNHFQLGSLSGLDFSWMVSNTLLDGFYRIARFFRVISSAGIIEIYEENCFGASCSLWYCREFRH